MDFRKENLDFLESKGFKHPYKNEKCTPGFIGYNRLLQIGFEWSAITDLNPKIISERYNERVQEWEINETEAKKKRIIINRNGERIEEDI